MAQDTIKCYDSPSDVVQALAEDFIAFTNEEINRTETCVVGITGGTVINGLLELLNSPEYIERLNWERIFFVWTDERFLPQSHEDNYFNRVKPYLLCKAKGAAHFLPINTDSKTVIEAAAEYVWFTVTGESKRTALTKVLYQREDYEDLPWEKRIGRVLPGAVLSQEAMTWYVDKAAYDDVH